MAPLFHTFLEKVAKRWPKLGYKRKKILLFHSFRATCKISLVPGTGLEPALLSEHAPETCASTNSAIRAGRTSISRSLQKTRQQMLPSLLVPRTRLELARLNRHYPLKVAWLPIPPPGLTSFRKRVQKYYFFLKQQNIFFILSFNFIQTFEYNENTFKK